MRFVPTYWTYHINILNGFSTDRKLCRILMVSDVSISLMVRENSELFQHQSSRFQIFENMMWPDIDRTCFFDTLPGYSGVQKMQSLDLPLLLVSSFGQISCSQMEASNLQVHWYIWIDWCSRRIAWWMCISIYWVTKSNGTRHQMKIMKWRMSIYTSCLPGVSVFNIIFQLVAVFSCLFCWMISNVFHGPCRTKEVFLLVPPTSRQLAAQALTMELEALAMETPRGGRCWFTWEFSEENLGKEKSSSTPNHDLKVRFVNLWRRTLRLP